MRISAAEIKFAKLVRSGHIKAVEELNRMSADKLNIGNPNHPANSGLFGYETSEFLAMQK